MSQSFRASVSLRFGADQPSQRATISATNTSIVIDFDAMEIGVDAQPYLTLSVSAVATVLQMAAFAALEVGRFDPALSAIV